MIEVNPTRFRLPPWPHQLRGVKTLLVKKVFGLWWKPRLGKSKAIIDTFCTLLENGGDVDTLLLVAPKQVKDIWLEKHLGEIVTHDWSGAKVYDYKEIDSLFLPHGQPCYVACSVEFIRQEGPRSNFPFVDSLLATLAGRRVWFVFDEGAVLGSHKSLNTKSVIVLRNGSPIERVTVLDGTPRGNSHLSFYSKFKVLSPAILGCKVFEQYRARYSELVKAAHGWLKDEKGQYVVDANGNRIVTKTHVEVVAEKNMDDFVRRTAPYCEYLEQDVLNMPKKVAGILTAAMSPKCWKAYTQMRDELIAEVDSGVCAVGQAAVKAMRLAQLCSGFLGGVQLTDQQGVFQGIMGAYKTHTFVEDLSPITVEVDGASTEMLMGWLKLKIAEDKDFQAVVWSRFKPEIERLVCRLGENQINHGWKYGGGDTYRNQLHPRDNYKGPYILVCQPQTAQYGNNFSKARTSIFLSQDYNRITRAQAAERVQADGAGDTTLELDVVVTGPRGQKTIVHDIINSVREREDAEKRTAREWIRILQEE